MFGPIFHDDATVEFRVLAKGCRTLSLRLGEEPGIPMEREEDGVFTIRVEAKEGDDYLFELPNGQLRPDPASRYQSEGVHGPSRLVDIAKGRDRDTEWRGMPWEELLIYELHIGTFTGEGTFRAAAERLPELVELGITAIELMPLADSAGRWNWGYDGVNLFAPQRSYGTPGDLMALIDRAHRLGLAVILDVVYNHLGPEGNYLGEFGGYLSRKHSTPWGDAPDFDGKKPELLRGFFLENVRYWLEDFGFDGLRVDATHCIADESDTHIVREMGETVAKLESRLGRPLHLIAESNIYDPHIPQSLEEGGCGFDGLWCDDFLHAVAAVVRPGEHRSDRVYDPGGDLDLVLRRGYVFQGTFGSERVRHRLDEVPGRVDTGALVHAIQHHDFVGNHPAGDRLHHLVGKDAHLAAAALLLLSPSIPMLFMGEEFATEAPFYFFVDFGDERLRRAVERGRRAEHPQHDWSVGESPVSEAAFLRSKIGPASRGDAETLAWYRELIALRRKWLASAWLNPVNCRAEWCPESSTAFVRYGEDAFFLVRLHGPEETPDVLEMEIADTEIVLSRGAEIENGRVKAGPFSVVAAKGVMTKANMQFRQERQKTAGQAG